jgi:hypothetical protein
MHIINLWMFRSTNEYGSGRWGLGPLLTERLRFVRAQMASSIRHWYSKIGVVHFLENELPMGLMARHRQFPGTRANQTLHARLNLPSRNTWRRSPFSVSRRRQAICLSSVYPTIANVAQGNPQQLSRKLIICWNLNPAFQKPSITTNLFHVILHGCSMQEWDNYASSITKLSVRIVILKIII